MSGGDLLAQLGHPQDSEEDARMHVDAEAGQLPVMTLSVAALAAARLRAGFAVAARERG